MSRSVHGDADNGTSAGGELDIFPINETLRIFTICVRESLSPLKFLPGKLSTIDNILFFELHSKGRGEAENHRFGRSYKPGNLTAKLCIGVNVAQRMYTRL